MSPDSCFRGQDRGSGDTRPDILVQLCPQHTHMSARAVTGIRAHTRVLLCSLPSGRTVAQPTAPNTMARDRTSRRGSHEAKRALPHPRLHLSPPALPATPGPAQLTDPGSQPSVTGHGAQGHHSSLTRVGTPGHLWAQHSTPLGPEGCGAGASAHPSQDWGPTPAEPGQGQAGPGTWSSPDEWLLPVQEG